MTQTNNLLLDRKKRRSLNFRDKHRTSWRQADTNSIKAVSFSVNGVLTNLQREKLNIIKKNNKDTQIKIKTYTSRSKYC